MHTYRLLGRVSGSTILLMLFTLFIAGCGSSSTSTTAAPTSTTTAANCSGAQLQTTTGTLQNIKGTTLLITNLQGNAVHVTYTDATRFVRQTLATTSVLKEGTSVAVVVTQNADNSYSATTISLLNRAIPSSRSRGNANAACANRSQSNNPGDGLSGSNGSSRSIMGTVSQLNGNTLTVTDFGGTDYTVQLTSSTKIEQSSSITADTLRVGMRVIATGSRGSGGILAARDITILMNS